jgi:hypothetical protein
MIEVNRRPGTRPFAVVTLKIDCAGPGPPSRPCFSRIEVLHDLRTSLARRPAFA